MKSKLIHEHHGEKTFALIFDTGDEAMAGLRRIRQGGTSSAPAISPPSARFAT